MARKVHTIEGDGWKRSAFYGASEITPLWMVRHTAHEGHHHLLDIQRGLIR